MKKSKSTSISMMTLQSPQRGSKLIPGFVRKTLLVLAIVFVMCHHDAG